ncbi:hypothetical protein DICPUDRAFT_46831, partial [Dictyostelium purpureum]
MVGSYNSDNTNNNEGDNDNNNNNKYINNNKDYELYLNDFEKFKENLLKDGWEDFEFLGKGSYGIVIKAKKKDGQINGIDIRNKYCVIKKKLKNKKLIFDSESQILINILDFKNDYNYTNGENLLLRYYYHEVKIEDEQEYFYIYTEFFNGKSLHRHVKEKQRIDDQDIVNITWRLLVALHILHCNQIMHRDISPNNILVSDDFKDIKLIDFGSSSHIISSSKSLCAVGRVGTLGFIAPEIIFENNYVGRKSDIWSVGTIVLYML